MVMEMFYILFRVSVTKSIHKVNRAICQNKIINFTIL